MLNFLIYYSLVICEQRETENNLQQKDVNDGPFMPNILNAIIIYPFQEHHSDTIQFKISRI